MIKVVYVYYICLGMAVISPIIRAIMESIKNKEKRNWHNVGYFSVSQAITLFFVALNVFMVHRFFK